MTQENKELLMKDISCRIPYGVIVNINGISNVKLISVSWYGEVGVDDGSTYLYPISEIKPYLFPMSSMTKEQLFEVQEILGKNEIEIGDGFLHIIDSDRNTITYLEILALLEWFYKNHFDIYGLIPKGLAIDATGLNIY